MSERRPRSLTSDEVALWSHVTRHVHPMPGKRRQEPPAPTPVMQAVPPAPPVEATLARKSPSVPASPPPSPPLVPLERRLRQRLARGNHPIDAVIDLHGMRQGQAHDSLRAFLLRAQSSGAAIVLVVTGKGGAAAGTGGLFEERGVLRRSVPHWLRLPELRAIVLGFEEAAAHHGGSGALYVRIRRRGASL